MEQVGVDELTRGTRCAKDLIGRDNSGFTVKGLSHLHKQQTPCLTPQLTLKGTLTSKFHTTAHCKEPYHETKIRIKAGGAFLLIRYQDLIKCLLASKIAQ